MTAVVEAVGLHKVFGSFSALDGLDLEVGEREVHGFLGPNGAGKSTTIRVLLGLYRPSGGEERLFGQKPWDRPDQLHRRLAYVPGDVALWPSLTGGEAIDLLIGLRGGTPRASQRDRLIDAFEFDPTKRIRTYSKGNRQKVALIAAFALPAELYVFDEPTSGLDPLMARRFQREVAQVAADGASVLLSSHILAEVEEVADRISIIRGGRRVESGTLAQLRHLTRTTYTIPVQLTPDHADRLARVADDVTEMDGRTTFAVEPAHTSKVLAVLAEAQVPGVTAQPLYLGVIALVFAALPRLTGVIAWATLALGVVLAELGGRLGLPEWAIVLSPFMHTPLVTTAQPDWSGAVWMSTATVGTAVLALVLYRRRDLQP